MTSSSQFPPLGVIGAVRHRSLTKESLTKASLTKDLPASAPVCGPALYMA